MRIAIALLLLGGVVGASLTVSSADGPKSDARAADSSARLGTAVAAAEAPRRGTIRGSFGYGRRYTTPKGLPRRKIEGIKERFEKEEEKQPRPPVPPGPYRAPQDPTTETQGEDYPFKPGRRSDEPRIRKPDWPKAGAAQANSIRVHRAGPSATSAAAGDFVMPRNQPVVKGLGFTSTVGEPSWANDGPVILYTGNWHAQVSEDDGINWDYLPPIDRYADREEVDGGFAGDQVVWAADHEGERLLFWTIMYFNDGTDNTIRVQVYHGGDEVVDQVGMCTYDFKPSDFYGQGAVGWLDQPRVASTDRWLYLAASTFDQQDQFVESMIWKIELEEIAQTDCESPMEYWNYINETNGLSDGQVQFVQGADDVMFWAYSDYRLSDQTLEVWRLPDSAEIPTGTSYPLSDYVSTYLGLGECTTPGPFVSNPCEDVTSTTRPEQGWISDEDFGWSWSVAQGEGFNYPHLRLARFDLSGNRPLIEEPDIYSQNNAWQYASIGVNGRGDKGLAAYAMGGGRNPEPHVRLVDDEEPSWANGVFHRIIASDDGVNPDRWGDYGAVREYDGCPNMFGASVYSMQGGPDDANSEARFAIFGREEDSCFDIGFQSRQIEFQDQLPRDPFVNVRGVLRNTGIGTVDAGTRIQFYASRDLLSSDDDIKLGTTLSRLPVLSSGDGAGFVTRLSIPSRVRGSRYLIACADPPQGRQLSRSNDCATTSRALIVARSQADVGIENVLVREPRRVATTRQHPVNARGTLQVQADLEARRTPSRKLVRFLLSKGSARSSKAIVLGVKRLGRARGGTTERFRLRAALRLPRAAKRGGEYTLFACALDRRSARPDADHCLPAVQRVIVRRSQ